MKQRSKPNDWTNSRTFGLRITLGLAGCCLFAIVGCSGSSSNESTVVQPPSLDGSPAETPPGEPPGTIEMPPGEIPAETSDDSATGQGGIELPENVELPVESGASVPPAIKYGTWEQIQTIAKSTGKVTVVDLWSLSCEPCLKEFPGLVRLHQSLGSSVQCIAVDLDFDGRKTRPPEYYEERVATFLESVGASGFPTYISVTSSDDVFAATELDSIPAVLIYDAEGKIVKVFADTGDSIGFTYDKDIIPLVSKLAG